MEGIRRFKKLGMWVVIVFFVFIVFISGSGGSSGKSDNEVIDMAKIDVLEREISIKLADQQWEFLENRTKELGISKEELVKWYIVSDMLKTIDAAKENKTKKKRFSLQGIVSAGTVTDKDIEKAKKIWQPKILP